MALLLEYFKNFLQRSLFRRQISWSKWSLSTNSRKSRDVLGGLIGHSQLERTMRVLKQAEEEVDKIEKGEPTDSASSQEVDG